MFPYLLALVLACTGYTVRAGDTLNRIARTNQTTVAALTDANSLANPNLIMVGQVLCIPIVPKSSVVVSGGSDAYRDVVIDALNKDNVRCPNLLSDLREIRIEDVMPAYTSGWADPVNRIAHVGYVKDKLFLQQVIIHEAVHVQLYWRGLDNGDETLASIGAASCYPYNQ